MGQLQDEYWMQRALDLAAKGRASVSPNPMVGACLVRAGKLVAEGWHEIYGGAHAEVQAIRKAGKRARGTTLYVTLEPCSSWGKTPPCAGAVLEAGIREVVIGTLDPNPKNGRRGAAALKKAGVKVRTGILEPAIRKQNEAFFKFIKTQRPFVTLKMAQSLDGKIATWEGKSRWITSPAARRFVHRLRFEQDAILIGKNTLLMDNPMLSPRVNAQKARRDKPWRVILDARLEASDHARVFQGPQTTLVAFSQKLIRQVASKKHLGQRNLMPVPEIKGRLDLKYLLDRLGGLGIAKVLVEGGGELSWSLLAAGLVDKILWIVAPKMIGGRAAKTSVEGEGIRNLEKAFHIRDLRVEKLGEDWLFEGEPANVHRHY